MELPVEAHVQARGGIRVERATAAQARPLRNQLNRFSHHVAKLDMRSGEGSKFGQVGHRAMIVDRRQRSTGLRPLPQNSVGASLIGRTGASANFRSRF